MGTSKRAWIVALAAWAAALSPVAAEPPKPGEAPDAAPQPTRTPREAVAPLEVKAGVTPVVSIRHTDFPLAEVLKELQQQTGVNFVATAEVDNDVRVRDVNLVNVPWRDALKVLLTQTEAVIEEESVNLVRIGRPPRVKMEFRNAQLAAVLDTIAKFSNVSIIISSQVQGTVTARFNNIPWNEAMDSLVKTGGFATVRESDRIIRIVDPRQLQAQLETRPYQLKYLRPPPKYNANIKSEYLEKAGGASGGAAPAAGAAGGGAATDFTLLNVVRSFLSKDASGKQIGALDFDRSTNTLIVTDTKPVLDKVGDMIQMLDVEPLQVYIDVNFVATRNEDLMTLGTNFGLGTDEGFTFTTLPLPPSTVPGLGSETASRFVRPFETDDVKATTAGLGAGRVSKLPFGFGQQRSSSEQLFLTRYDFLSTLRIFQKDKFSKVVQRPQISTLDNQEATIFVGEQIAYAATKAAATQSGATTFEISEASKSPINVGFQLLIIPNIIPDTRKIIMTVIPKNDSLAGDPSTAGGKIAGFERYQIAGLGPGGSTLSIDLPRIRTSTVVTRMILEDGQTGMIGGLVQDETGQTVTKIPILGDIPILGYAFKQKQDTIIKEHLFIFVTARLVRSTVETVAVMEEHLRKRSEGEGRAFDALRRGDRAAEELLERQMQERQKRGEQELEKLKQAPK